MNDLETKMRALVNQVASALQAKGWMLVTAESCTGGLIGASCTEVAGSSSWFYGGVISYDNGAKMNGLGVKESTLEEYGAVSEQTVHEMCAGALELGGDVSVAVSGVAGPSGGSDEKPVGCVYIGWQIKGQEAEVIRCQFEGDRKQIRERTVIKVLENLIKLAA